MTLLALFSTLAYVGRVIFASIPNVQPMSTVLLLITLHLGLIDGLIVTVLSLILSNLFLGFGPWTVYQVIAYSLVLIVTTPVLKRTPFHLVRSLIAGFSGLLYGFVISLLFVKTYQINHFWSYYLRGIPFDLNHMIGNIVFYYTLEPVIIRLFHRLATTHKNKLE